MPNAIHYPPATPRTSSYLNATQARAPVRRTTRRPPIKNIRYTKILYCRSLCADKSRGWSDKCRKDSCGACPECWILCELLACGATSLSCTKQKIEQINKCDRTANKALHTMLLMTCVSIPECQCASAAPYGISPYTPMCLSCSDQEGKQECSSNQETLLS